MVGIGRPRRRLSMKRSCLCSERLHADGTLTGAFKRDVTMDYERKIPYCYYQRRRKGKDGVEGTDCKVLHRERRMGWIMLLSADGGADIWPQRLHWDGEGMVGAILPCHQFLFDLTGIDYSNSTYENLRTH